MKKEYFEILRKVEKERNDYKKALSELVTTAQLFSPVTLYIEDLSDGLYFGFSYRNDNFLSNSWLLPVDRFIELISTMEEGTEVNIHVMISLCV